MAAFTFKSPEGQSYTVNGPEGATQEQAFGVVQQHVANQRAQGVVPISEKAIDTAPAPGGPRNVPGAEGFDPTRAPTDEQGNDATGKLSDILTGPKQILGAGENILSGALSGAGSLIEAVGDRIPGVNIEPGSISGKAYQPHTAAGIEQAAAMGKGAGALGHAAFEHIIAPSMRKLGHSEGDVEATRQTLAERVPQALGAATTVVPLIKGVTGLARGAAPIIGEGEAAPASAADVRAAGPPQSALEEVQRNGYKITPSSVPVRNPSVKPRDVPGSLRESLTSSPQGTEQIIRDNAVTSTGHIGGDFGVQNATKLLPQHFDAAKVAPGKFYDAAGDAVGTVGEKAPVLPETHQTIKTAIADNTPDAPNTETKVMLGQIEAALDNGKYTGPKLIKNLSFLREQNNPVARAVADQLEKEMGNQLKDQPKVLGDFRNARTEFAKIYDAQDATVGGQIDAGVYARLARRRPDLLTGGAAKVAQAGQEIPHLTRLPNPMSDKSPVGSTVLGTVRNIIAPRIAKLPGMDITNPALQRRIGQSAPPPGPLPSPDRLIGPPGAKPTGGLPPQLGEALSPTPGGPVIRPLQRGNKLPQATSLKMTKQLFDQIKRREEQLPGTLEP